MADPRPRVAVPVTAARFHRGPAAAVAAVRRAARRVVPECAAAPADGFTVLRHRRVPPDDGGLAPGRLVVAARAER